MESDASTNTNTAVKAEICTEIKEEVQQIAQSTQFAQQPVVQPETPCATVCQAGEKPKEKPKAPAEPALVAAFGQFYESVRNLNYNLNTSGLWSVLDSNRRFLLNFTTDLIRSQISNSSKDWDLYSSSVHEVFARIQFRDNLPNQIQRCVRLSQSVHNMALDCLGAFSREYTPCNESLTRRVRFVRDFVEFYNYMSVTERSDLIEAFNKFVEWDMRYVPAPCDDNYISKHKMFVNDLLDNPEKANILQDFWNLMKSIQAELAECNPQDVSQRYPSEDYLDNTDPLRDSRTGRPLNSSGDHPEECKTDLCASDALCATSLVATDGAEDCDDNDDPLV